MLRGGICRASVDAFDFRRLCTGVTHPRPLFGTGRFGRCFLVGSERFDGMVSPLERGDWDGTFLFVGEEFSVDVSLL